MGYTEKEIIKGITEVIEFLGISRMPTRSEVIEYYGNTSLASRISNTGGFYKWAEKLGLEVKECESKLAHDIETIYMSKLKEMGYKCEMTSYGFPYDLLVEDCLKIDVKAARVSKVYTADVYSFYISKRQPTCDLFMAACLDSNKQIIRTYIIPSYVLTGKKQLCMGAGNSRYDKYLDRWDLIDKMIDAVKVE